MYFNLYISGSEIIGAANRKTTRYNCICPNIQRVVFLPYIVDYIVGIYNLPLLLLYPFMCYRCTPLPAVLGACLTSSQYSTAPVSSEDLQLIQTILKWPPENTFPGWQLEHTQHRITLLLFCKELCMP